MAGMEDIGLCCRLVSGMAAGTFFGAGLYVTLVECPARRMMASANLMLDNWQETFSRAKSMQSKIAMFSMATGFVGWYTDTDPQRWLTLVSSGLMFSVVPVTIMFIKPINDTLLDVPGAKKKGDDWIAKRLDQWCTGHTTRVYISGGAMIAAALYWANKVKNFL